jgi:hypothetical protein
MVDFKKGDHVTWKTSQGETKGKVVGTQMSDVTIKGHDIKASKADPKYVVRSEAAHKPGSLKPV